MRFNTKYLDNKLFSNAEEGEKCLIVLQHSYTRREEGVEGVLKHWKYSGGKIATPYLIDTDGKIYKIYEDCYWSYHTGLGRYYDLISIGITLVNEGPLVRKGSEWLTVFGSLYRGEVWTNPAVWRDYIYFAKYTPAQVEATVECVLYLLEKYSIPRNLPKQIFEFNRDYFNFKGILFHCSLVYHRTDLSVAFPVEELRKSIM